jgi:hypothetical protein
MIAPLRSEPEKFAESRDAPVKSAPFRREFTKMALLRDWPLKSLPVRSRLTHNGGQRRKVEYKIPRITRARRLKIRTVLRKTCPNLFQGDFVVGVLMLANPGRSQMEGW